MKSAALSRTAGIGLLFLSLGAGGCAGEPDESSGVPEDVDVTSEPLAATETIGMVRVRLMTGGDDKRSDSRVWICVGLKNGNVLIQETYDAMTWRNWTWNDVTYVSLPSGTLNRDIYWVQVFWRQGGGGWNGDNWNLQQVTVEAYVNSSGLWNLQGQAYGNPLRRLTGSVTSWVWFWVQ